MLQAIASIKCYKYQPFLLTPRLEILVGEMGAGQSVHEEVLAYAVAGYQLATALLIMTAACGDSAARSALPRFVVHGGDRTQQELNKCLEDFDLDAPARKALLMLNAEKKKPGELERLKRNYPAPKAFADVDADTAEDTVLQNVARSHGLRTAGKLKLDLMDLDRRLMAERRSGLERIRTRYAAVMQMARTLPRPASASPAHFS